MLLDRHRRPDHLCLLTCLALTTAWYAQHPPTEPSILPPSLIPWPVWPPWAPVAEEQSGFIVLALSGEHDGQAFDLFGFGAEERPVNGPERSPRAGRGLAFACLCLSLHPVLPTPGRLAAVQTIGQAVAEWERALRGQALRRRGKRTGDGRLYTDAEFRAQLGVVIHDLQRATRRPYVEPEPAWNKLGLSRSAFYAYLRRVFGQDWATLCRNYADFDGLAIGHTPGEAPIAQ